GGGLYALSKINHRTLLPPQRYRVVPWGSIETAIVLFMLYSGVPSIVMGILAKSGFFSWLYGIEFPVPFSHHGPDKLPDFVVDRWNIWNALFSFPVQVAIIPIILYLGSGTRPYQLGLTLHRWVENIAAGCLAWLLLTPLVLGVNIL